MYRWMSNVEINSFFNQLLSKKKMRTCPYMSWYSVYPVYSDNQWNRIEAGVSTQKYPKDIIQQKKIRCQWGPPLDGSIPKVPLLYSLYWLSLGRSSKPRYAYQASKWRNRLSTIYPRRPRNNPPLHDILHNPTNHQRPSPSRLRVHHSTHRKLPRRHHDHILQQRKHRSPTCRSKSTNRGIDETTRECEWTKATS